MRRIVSCIILLAFVLVACGGGSADTTVGDPPQSQAYTKGSNAQIDKIVEAWQTVVPEELKAQSIKDPIEEHVYSSTASLQDVATFYQKLTEHSWVQASRMPGIQDSVLLTGYSNGNTSLVVGAIDASKLGGSGVVIYTAKGSK